MTQSASDRAFMMTLEEISRAYTVFSKSQRLCIEKWVEKLVNTGTKNPTWRRHRNSYAALLLNMALARNLGEPFTTMPPEGPLPTFPAHLKLNFRNILGTRESSFWRGMLQRVDDLRIMEGESSKADYVYPHGGSSATAEAEAETTVCGSSREQSLDMLVKEQSLRIQLLEQQLRDERLQHELTLQRLQFAQTMELSKYRDGASASSAYTQTATKTPSVAASFPASSAYDRPLSQHALASIGSIDRSTAVPLEHVLSARAAAGLSGPSAMATIVPAGNMAAVHPSWALRPPFSAQSGPPDAAARAKPVTISASFPSFSPPRETDHDHGILSGTHFDGSLSSAVDDGDGAHRPHRHRHHHHHHHHSTHHEHSITSQCFNAHPRSGSEMLHHHIGVAGEGGIDYFRNSMDSGLPPHPRPYTSEGVSGANRLSISDPSAPNAGSGSPWASPSRSQHRLAHSGSVSQTPVVKRGTAPIEWKLAAEGTDDFMAYLESFQAQLRKDFELASRRSGTA